MKILPQMFLLSSIASILTLGITNALFGSEHETYAKSYQTLWKTRPVGIRDNFGQLWQKHPDIAVRMLLLDIPKDTCSLDLTDDSGQIINRASNEQRYQEKRGEIETQLRTLIDQNREKFEDPELYLKTLNQ